MKLLYLSCHSILEYDELRIFHELGIDVFSHGAYHNPQKLDDKKRPPLDIPYHKEFSDTTLLYPKENLDPELIKWADTVIVMHVYDWIWKNLKKLKKKRVILRTIGQNITNDEGIINQLVREGVEIVRYSQRERTIPGFAGQSYLIRFGKDPSEFGPWTGKKQNIITVAQSFNQRDFSCNYSIFDKATKGFPRKVYGPHNENLGLDCAGCPDYSNLRKVLNESLMYFYTGTYPASYTLNFIEASMSGLPMVALGEVLGNSPDFPSQQTYEVDDLLKRYEAGLTGNSIDELRQKTTELYSNEQLRKKLSNNIREMAMDLFDKNRAKEQWKKFLKV